MKMLRYAAVCLSLGSASAAMATETASYEYDALGRLVRVIHTNGPANGVVVVYTFDPADNRTNVTITGGK